MKIIFWLQLQYINISVLKVEPHSHPAGSGGGTGEGGAKLQDKMEFCHDYQVSWDWRTPGHVTPTITCHWSAERSVHAAPVQVYPLLVRHRGGVQDLGLPPARRARAGHQQGGRRGLSRHRRGRPHL